MARTVFTIWEGDAALYLSTDTNLPLGPAIFIGHCFERIDCAFQHTVRRRGFLGERYQQNYNEDEQHTIELRNAFQVSGSGEIKSLDRFARHILVIVWHDEEHRVWLRRTYFGVTVAAGQVGGETVIEDATTLNAERFIAAPDADEWPTLEPDTLGGQVDYVKGAVRIPLYSYNGAGEFVALPSQDDALGRIFEEDGVGLKFEIEGEAAMLVDDMGIVVAALIATGGSFFDTSLAKLDFRTGGVRVATLVKDGTLAVPTASNATVAPGGPTDIELRPDGVWAASLGEGRTSAKSFTTP